jgi:hypothetical protein
MESCALGSQVKFATVTVDLPQLGKVFFLAFKGTSYLMDFLKWDVSRSYSATGHNNCFVHAGAAGVLQELTFRMEAEFVECLSAAHKNGTTRMVITGHSLGGMYAMGLLYTAYKKRGDGNIPSGAAQMLRSCRCITFGAPMGFGVNANKEPSPEFKAFEEHAAKRAVNFMHESDPCPRAWSALDIRDFVMKAADALKESIVEERGGVMGGIAAQVVDAAVDALVRRPDFEHIVNSAKDFRHFARIEYLCSDPTLHWQKDFVLSKRGLEDHSMLSYLEKIQSMH